MSKDASNYSPEDEQPDDENSDNYLEFAGQLQEAFNGAGEDDIGEEIGGNEGEVIVKKPPKNPSFPAIIFLLALVKDALDILLDLSIIGTLAATILSVAIGIILFFWCLGKGSGGWWKKRMMRGIWKRFIITLAIEFIPFIQMFPAETFFVWMCHNKEKKIVRIFNEALEQFHKTGSIDLKKIS